MIKIWPIHKHNWTYQEKLGCSCISHSDVYAAVLISCYCGKIKTYKLPPNYCWNGKTVKSMMEVKGWWSDGEVQYIR